jgi:hypothetical protein
MPRNAARQINRATVVKCAISATFCHPQLFEITAQAQQPAPPVIGYLSVMKI